MSENETPTAAPAVRPHRASYSPQDDKIRLFFAFRIPRPEWDRLRELGFTWTMKQACDMVAPWTPAREDAALELCEEIEDEDEPREARSADRAERFSGYLEKREGEAEALADRYDAGPRVHAAQDSGRAERAAARHDRIGGRAASKWETAEYWAQRTRGVIAHALYLERADVRHRRIKGIESEILGLEKRTARAKTERALWAKVAAMTDTDAQNRCALRLSNVVDCWGDWQHPTNPARREHSLWSLLREDQPAEDRITGAQAAALYLERAGDPEAPRSSSGRWLAHLRLRLAYEAQMLEAQGGTLANVVEIVAGGFVGRHQVVKVSKDRAGRVSKVYVLAPKGYGSDPEKLAETGISAERLEPGSYRAPTPEELAAFVEAKKARSAAKPKAPPLINPDEESAARIQALWNEWARAGYVRGLVRQYGPRGEEYAKNFEPSAVLETTQETSTRASAGSYGRAETVEIRADGSMRSNSNMWSGARAARDKAFPVVCRLRVALCGNTNGPRRVVVLTDKPRAPLPQFVPTARFTENGDRITEAVSA